jgi:hypothetical protein
VIRRRLGLGKYNEKTTHFLMETQVCIFKFVELEP